MRESPRHRRLKSDHKSLVQLATESTIFRFQAFGSPADFYILKFHGRGCDKAEALGGVRLRDEHEVHVRLGASYPRMMPELAWKSPIFHPNISASGVVCLGGYGTYWVPSLALDELCGMLWDMIRYENYDETSPYNREAAGWAKNQTDFPFPLDRRPLRDKLADLTVTEVENDFAVKKSLRTDSSRGGSPPVQPSAARPSSPRPPAVENDVLFIGEVEIIEAQAVHQRPSRQASGDQEILFIE